MPKSPKSGSKGVDLGDYKHIPIGLLKPFLRIFRGKGRNQNGDSRIL